MPHIVGIIFGISVVPSFALYRGLAYLGLEVSFQGPGLKTSDISNDVIVLTLSRR